MHDEFRVDVHTPHSERLLDALKHVEKDAGSNLPRLAVTHSGDEVFLYADSQPAAEQGRAALQRALDAAKLDGKPSVTRWHPLEERWEDITKPLPSTDAERAAEHARLEEEETEESEHAGYPEWEVRVSLPSHHDARALAERLRGESIPVAQHWRYLLIGAEDEDDAAALAQRIRVEAPAGSEIHTEGSGRPYWEMLHPFAYLGGIGN
ncbi:MAG TPA: hypothetical protein VMU32_02250 [Solirubrobacteraceae bacterium]|nr:hypothetical protein [Solirubrobacteraceae bacterium]